MRIYQIHKCGGQWEDSYDYIIGSYLKKERAEEEKVKAEKKESTRIERHKKCCNCPIVDNDLQADTLEYAKHTCGSYCGNAQIYEDKFGYGCENYECSWDDSSFSIDEVEVEE